MSGAVDTRSCAASGQLVDSPRQSFLPLAMGFGVTVLLVGLLASRPALAFGALIVLVTAIVWIARLIGNLALRARRAHVRIRERRPSTGT